MFYYILDRVVLTYVCILILLLMHFVLFIKNQHQIPLTLYCIKEIWEGKQECRDVQ